jgi:homoserine kinase type II
MAVYTHIEDDELEAFLADYDVGGLTSFKGIAEGVENSNYLVHTEKDRFILTLYEARVEEKDLPFFLELMHHLADRGITCPLPVQDRRGQVLKTLAGRPAVMVTFLEGVSVARPKRHHCEEVGRSLARMHLAGLDFPMRRANALGIVGWNMLFSKCHRDMDEIHPGLYTIVENELFFLDGNWPEELPAGIIHADLFPDNVFFIKDRLSGLIDFYFACTDLLAYDLAICLNAWCFEQDGSLNLTHARAMLAGYEAVRPLSNAEREAMPTLARGAALRFLMTRIHDWLNTREGALVKRKDPMEYLRKLRFHQEVASVADYGFELG